MCRGGTSGASHHQEDDSDYRLVVWAVNSTDREPRTRPLGGHDLGRSGVGELQSVMDLPRRDVARVTNGFDRI